MRNIWQTHNFLYSVTFGGFMLLLLLNGPLTLWQPSVHRAVRLITCVA